MHIAFLTLFLGLVSGRVPFELAVTGQGPGVAAIDLRLDGAPAGRLAGPPWKGEVDLGKDLLPHHLEARALDAAGAPAGSAEQWLNLPQRLAEVDLVPEPGPDGRIAAVRLSFQTVTHEEPTAVTATLDGKPLPVAGGRVALPAYKPDLPHLLAIEALYARGFSAHRDLAFGGGLEGQVSTELTAILLRARRSLPPLQDMRDWFVDRIDRSQGGQPLSPVAVEEGPGELFVVRAPGTGQILRNLFHARDGIADPNSQFELPIASEDRLRFVDSSPSQFGNPGAASTLFGLSAELDGRKVGLYWWLTRLFPFRESSGPPHLADAVATAGVKALGDQRRRAVLLVLSGAGADASLHDAASVRRYLAAIRVPLYVWCLDVPPYSPAITAWGEVENVSTAYKMRYAYGRLTRDLASQRIVWVDGRHLPQSIALSPQAAGAVKGLELVAGPER
jgi:hypothetical protein